MVNSDGYLAIKVNERQFIATFFRKLRHRGYLNKFL